PDKTCCLYLSCRRRGAGPAETATGHGIPADRGAGGRRKRAAVRQAGILSQPVRGAQRTHHHRAQPPRSPDANRRREGELDLQERTRLSQSRPDDLGKTLLFPRSPGRTRASIPCVDPELQELFYSLL